MPDQDYPIFIVHERGKNNNPNGMVERVALMDKSGSPLSTWTEGELENQFTPRSPSSATAGAFDVITGSTEVGTGTDMIVSLGGSTSNPHTIGNGVALATISGGYNNEITTGIAQTISGGAHHIADNASGHGYIGGGSYQTVRGAYSVAVGGFENDAESDYAAVVGGRQNVAGDPADRSGKRDQFVGAGVSNEAKGDKTVIGGGNNNQCDGAIGVISGGDGNTIQSTGVGGAVGGGSANMVSSTYGAIAGGIGARTSRYGEFAHASGVFTANGDAQAAIMVARATTTNATQTELFLDGAAATQRMVVSSDSTWLFEINLVARRTDVDSESAAYHYRGCIDRNAGVATTALVGSVVETVVSEDTPAWSVLVDANTAQGALRIRVTGEAAKTIRWVARVDVVMVTG